jgi:hypothetical protein
MSGDTPKPTATRAPAPRAAPAAHDLPAKPDFAAIDAASPATADKRTRVLALIGNLVFGWSNNESMLIYVLMLLLETDKISAAIVFTTLNTTRARLDLIQRLAKAKIADQSLRTAIDKLVDRFSQSTRERNEFNHCVYSVNDQGEITHTQTMRVREVRGRLVFGENRKMDQARLNELIEISGELKRLNRDIWDLLPRLQAYFARQKPAADNAGR